MSKKAGRTPKKYSQAARLHDMIRILEARYGATVEDLVEECQVTRRTVYRDLQAIIEAGYPLVSERQDDGRVLYSFVSGFSKIPPITFTLEELMTLYFSRGQLSFLQGTPFQDDLDAIFGKIRSSLPPRSVAHLERIAEASVPRFRGFKDYSVQSELLTNLRQALLKQKRCEIVYRPAKREPTTYLVDPYTLLFFNNGLYIGGYAHNRRDVRLFAIERVQSLKVTAERFDVPEDYSADLLTGTAFGLIGEGDLYDLDVEFSADIAYLISERIWHPEQRLDYLEDGRIRLRFQASGDKEILSWLYSFLPHVKVRAPEVLKQQFAEGLRQALTDQDSCVT